MNREELLKIAKPILFNTEMVQVILEGRKTVTRRLVKPKSKNACGFFVTHRKSDGEFMGVYDYDENEQMFESSQTPPATPGDIFYVRETWNHYKIKNCQTGKCEEGYFYKASSEDIEELPEYVQYHWGERWKPSIHMPKDAARIFLKVTDVRVERLQDITEEDAYKEGTNPWDETCYEDNGWHPTLADPDSGGDCDIIAGFHKLWNSTIKKSELYRYGWDANPWVWVIEFERIGEDAGI